MCRTTKHKYSSQGRQGSDCLTKTDVLIIVKKEPSQLQGEISVTRTSYKLFPSLSNAWRPPHERPPNLFVLTGRDSAQLLQGYNRARKEDFQQHLSLLKHKNAVFLQMSEIRQTKKEPTETKRNGDVRVQNWKNELFHVNFAQK